MCGITGIYRFDGAPVDRESLARMNETMVPRGPDDAGLYIRDNFGMAMRRLSIIDLAGGHQPISNENGTLHVVLNGEIYNYVELRAELERRGHGFKTRSDVEVLLHLYEEEGFEAIHRLNGMYAFCLWDEPRRLLWLGRDRLGVKPLVYANTDKTFVFGSTSDAVLASGEVPKSLDDDAFLLYLGLSYVPAPRTVYRGVKKLLPGHHIVVRDGRVTIRSYWDIRTLPPGPSADNADVFVEQTRELLKSSVELHSRSDVAVGCFLSGGVDSSSTTALFCGRSAQPVHTFSVDFEGKDVSELPYARMVAERYRTNHHPYEMSYRMAFEEWLELMPLMDEPIADSALIPSYFLSKKAREHGIKVILTGAGGDELFGGYARHVPGRRDMIAGRIPFIPSSVWIAAGRINGNLTHYGLHASHKGLSFAAETSGVHLGRLSSLMRDPRAFRRAVGLVEGQFSGLSPAERQHGFSYARMLTDARNYLPDDVLSLADKTSMAASVEGRVPLLDHRLVEWVFRAPPSTNLNGSPKSSLKKAMAGYLPEAILTRGKAGFNGPVGIWVGNGFRNEILSRMEASRDAYWRDFIDFKRLKSMMEGSARHAASACESVFALAVFDLWCASHL